MSSGGQPSITEAYLRGEQQEILRREHEFDRTIKRSQLETLMRERVAAKRRTTQGYIQAYEKFTDPDTPTSDLGRLLTEGGAEDAPAWVEARAKARQRQDERDADMAQVQEILDTKTIFGEESPGPERPIPRQSLLAGLQARAIGKRQAETQEAITARTREGLRSKEDIARERLAQQKAYQDVLAQVAVVRQGLDEKRMQEYDLRIKKLLSQMRTGFLPDYDDLVTDLIAMQTSDKTPSSDTVSKAVLAATDMREDFESGMDGMEAFLGGLKKHGIGEAKESVAVAEESARERAAREAPTAVTPPEAKAAAESTEPGLSDEEAITRTLKALKLSDTLENRARVKKRLEALKAP